jgi:hypothetical protein
MLGGWSEANPRQRNRNPYLKIIKAKKKKKKKKNKPGGCGSSNEGLPSKEETLNSNPSTI